jgi:hypothetical protein
MDEAEIEEATRLVNSLLGKIKAPIGAVRETLADSDWAFVIKLHSMIEAALNHLLTEHFGDPRLSDFFSELEVGRMKTGKMALIKALDLLPSESLAFIKWLSEARNRTAHRVDHLDFSLAHYITGMGDKCYKNLIAHISAMLPNAEVPTLMQTKPRLAVFAGVCVILCEIESYVTDRRKLLEPPDYNGDEPQESTPTGL